MSEQMDVDITELRFRSEGITVFLRLTENNWGCVSGEQWALVEGTHTVMTFDKGLYERAQQEAARYLTARVQEETIRQEAAEKAAEIMQSYAGVGALLRPPHVSEESVSV